MGCIDSKNNPYAGSKDEKEASRKIDEMIRKDRKELEHEVKLLLLGTFSSPSPPRSPLPPAAVLPLVASRSLAPSRAAQFPVQNWDRCLQIVLGAGEPDRATSHGRTQDRVLTR